MNDNSLPVLRITNIEWDKDHDELHTLPQQLELRWDKKNWDTEDVSRWLNIKFDWVFSSLNIEQVGTWEDNGDCSCC
tara:strand:- start:1156 stop:1386 length:231 start_codon:yes stop_codon:yes gene_type:complete